MNVCISEHTGCTVQYAGICFICEHQKRITLSAVYQSSVCPFKVSLKKEVWKFFMEQINDGTEIYLSDMIHQASEWTKYFCYTQPFFGKKDLTRLKKLGKDTWRGKRCGMKEEEQERKIGLSWERERKWQQTTIYSPNPVSFLLPDVNLSLFRVCIVAVSSLFMRYATVFYDRKRLTF